MGQAGTYLQSDVTDLVYEYCNGNTYDFTSSDSYITNFQAIKTFFISQSAELLYSKAASTLGSSSSSFMYAVYQCRGDISLSQCYACVSNALSVDSICDRWRRQLAACFVRYDYVPFYSDDAAYLRDLWNTTCSFSTISSSPFASNLASALSAVTDAAPNHALFGFHAVHVGTGASSVYTLGQCVGYLTPLMCSECLAEASKEYEASCGNSAGGDIYIGACYLIVSQSADFLFDPSVVVSKPASPTTPDLPPTAPDSPTTMPDSSRNDNESSTGTPVWTGEGGSTLPGSDGKKKKKKNKLKSIGGVVGLVFTVLGSIFSCVCCVLETLSYLWHSKEFVSYLVEQRRRRAGAG